MGLRTELQTMLEDILGSSNVYFQPDENVKMKYPAIVYTLDDVYSSHADDHPYKRDKRYALTYIDRSPLSAVPDKLLSLRSARFVREYPQNGLNHTIVNLYY